MTVRRSLRAAWRDWLNAAWRDWLNAAWRDWLRAAWRDWLRAAWRDWLRAGWRDRTDTVWHSRTHAGWRDRLRTAWRGTSCGARRAGRDGWLLAGAALALGASFLNPGLTIERPRLDDVIVLDVTQSMNVTDLRLDGKPVARLAYAKHVLREALLRMPCGSKVGWAIFTEYRSFLLIAPIEVCANLSELRSTLDRIDGRMAWAGNSEIAKGLHSAIGIARLLPGPPALVFVTDGHEAPPLNARYRPAFDDKPGEVAGLIVGVGDRLASPIPKTDPQGRPLGFWGADEVLQTDPRSQGRGASVSGEALVDERAGDAAPSLDARPGSEHLSALREDYLRLLAREQGMGFHRLDTTPALMTALTSPALSRPLPIRSDARAVLAGLALCLLLGRYLPALVARVRALARRTPAV